MQYADNRALRATMHRAYATRASELGARPWDNTPSSSAFCGCATKPRELLGYAHYAAISLVPKMAESADEVLDFLRDLGRRARPFAERDYAELTAFARDELGLADLAPWDVAYASEKLKAKRSAFSEQEVRQFFPEDRVLAGLFRSSRRSTASRSARRRPPTWHPDRALLRPRRPPRRAVGPVLSRHVRARGQAGRRLDGRRDQPPPRGRARAASGRLPHVQPFRAGRRQAGDVHAPRSHHHLPRVRARPAPPADRVDVAGVSGIQGVEWDAVELPSQIMENFCWEWDVVTT